MRSSEDVGLINRDTLGRALKVHVLALMKEKWVFCKTDHLIRQKLKGDSRNAGLGGWCEKQRAKEGGQVGAAVAMKVCVGKPPAVRCESCVTV